MLALRTAQRRGISDKIELRVEKKPEASRIASAATQAPAQPSVRPAATPSTRPAGAPSWQAFVERPTLMQRIARLFQRIFGLFRAAPAPSLPPPATRATSPTEQLKAALGELSPPLVIKDEAALLRDLLATYQGNDQENARLFALVATLKASTHVSNVPSDQVLIHALRRALG
jgi:hypothetical protein